MPKIAILVLGCASGQYVGLIDTIRRTWGRKRVDEADIFYLFGTVEDEAAHTALTVWLGGDIPPVVDGGLCDVGGILMAGCPDSIHVQEDCILHKRLIAFDYLASQRDYEFIYTVCAASYVDQFELVRHIAPLGDRSLLAGAVGIDTTGSAPFVSGASMLLSADVARNLAKNRTEVASESRFGFRDDVAIGQWVAKHMSGVKMEAILEAIRNAVAPPRESLFVPSGYTTVNFVLARPDVIKPRSDVFHYHFHSAMAQEMEDFHDRYFLHQTRSLWEAFSEN